MKRHGNLTDITASDDNVMAAWKESTRRRPKNRSRIKQMGIFGKKLVDSLNNVQHIIQTGEWPISEDDYSCFYRWQCGKLREICWNKCYMNNVVMHAMMRTDGRILEKSLITDTFSGIIGRGPLRGLIRMKEYLSEYKDDDPIYILKIDIRHFYDSINKQKLFSLIKTKIKDRTSLKMHEAAIMSCPRPGIPKGNLTSQIYANFYLSPLDHYVKEKLGFRHYARYCDDIVILDPDKSRLHALLEAMRIFLAEYSLEIKPNAQVFPIERGGIDFMGYVFHRHEVRLRKRIERSIRKAAMLYKQEPSMAHYRTLAAYWGWVKHISRPMAFWMAVVGKPLKELMPKEEHIA